MGKEKVTAEQAKENDKPILAGNAPCALEHFYQSIIALNLVREQLNEFCISRDPTLGLVESKVLLGNAEIIIDKCVLEMNEGLKMMAYSYPEFDYKPPDISEFHMLRRSIQEGGDS